MEVNKYLIAILPPEPIATEIYRLKEYVRDKYNSKASLNSPAHITMHMPFEWKTTKESQLVAAINTISFQPFVIDLNDFGCFEPRVIFVDMKNNPALMECQAQVMRLCKTELNLFNAGYKDHPFHPHVTIAFRDLKKNEFAKAWEEFKARTYSASFECAKVSLLKHDGKQWRTLV